jgi:N-hydroxyarylamine O-acetyltransferase
MNADTYLARIGAPRPQRADLSALRELQLRHLHTVPFENLSIHLDEGISLDPKALYHKIVDRRRGGFCYELNGLFGWLLTELGYEVTLLAARVHGASSYGPLFDHLALRVDLEQPWLVDVGFGRFSHYPLRMDTAGDQADPGGVFRVEHTADGDLAVTCDGEPEYIAETRPRQMADFEPGCWWNSTSPKSHFTRSLTCSRLTDTGRITLSDHLLIETTDQGRREQLLDDAGVLKAYPEHFGFVLDRLPALDV